MGHKNLEQIPHQANQIKIKKEEFYISILEYCIINYSRNRVKTLKDVFSDLRPSVFPFIVMAFLSDDLSLRKRRNEQSSVKCIYTIWKDVLETPCICHVLFFNWRLLLQVVFLMFLIKNHEIRLTTSLALSFQYS